MVERDLYGQSILYDNSKTWVCNTTSNTTVDELTDAVQFTIMGRLPINLTGPTTLQAILRNIFLYIPEHYELIAGTRIENIHLYYDLIKTAVIGDAHHL